MNFLLILVASTAISLAVIPLMMKLAPALGMVDEPNSRKVHAHPVPRVGGVGIVLGSLTPLAVWVPIDATVVSYLVGAIILLVFGVWDDRVEIGHYTKFIGQFLAVLPVVSFGDLYVDALPFLGVDDMPHVVGRIFTAVALVGMINATNHADGLDGLAGGVSLLSLGAMSVLAFAAGDFFVLAVCTAGVGGILGFLRFNTHPATVFMGDGGSQFLGFTVGFLAVYLVVRMDPTLSPAVVLLLLGLPIADILMVLYRRITQGKNWFRATKNHIHHQLLHLGFVHQESVVIIYSLQTLFVLSGLALRYAHDWIIVAVYLVICTCLFTALALAAWVDWQAHRSGLPNAFGQAVSYLHTWLFVVPPRRFLKVGIPAYLELVSIWVTDVPKEFGIAAVVVTGLMVLELIWGKRHRSVTRRGLIYVTAAFAAYLDANHPPFFAASITMVETAFFILVAISIGVAVRFSPARRKFEFRPTAMDYLMVFVLLAGLIFSQDPLSSGQDAIFVIQMVLLFYGCELLIIEGRERWSLLSIGSVLAAGIFAGRGIVPL